MTLCRIHIGFPMEMEVRQIVSKIVNSSKGSATVSKKWTSLLCLLPLTPRVNPWVIQSFLTFDSMYITLKCDHSLESC